MKFGFLQVYNEKEWIGPQIDQIMMLCDNLLITEGSNYPKFPNVSERSTDGTLDFIHDKMREYPSRISLNTSIRKHSIWNQNKCDNFNRALTFCKDGDYFMKQDADEFYTNEHIARLNEQMKEHKADVINSWGYCFAFGFKWRRIRNEVQLEGKDHILKKNPALYFVPTHMPRKMGPIVIQNKDEDYLGRFHYSWVRTTSRKRIQHLCEDPKMLKWFDTYWGKIQLINGKRYNYYRGHFVLERYEGRHPEILDDHPWRNVEDVRDWKEEVK